MAPARRVLIVGGCYAGLATATNLLDLSEGRAPRFSPDEPASTSRYSLEITIVDERDGFYHVIGSPLALAKESFAARAWTRFPDIPGLQHPSVNTVHGSVTKIDAKRKIATIRSGNAGTETEKQYDYLLAASGLRRESPTVPSALTRDGYLAEASRHTAAVKAATRGVVVVGGGAVGIEMAAELKLVYPDLRVTLVHSRDRLLSSEPLPDDFKDETLKQLRDTGVDVLTNRRVNQVSEPDESDGTRTLTLSDGSKMTTSFVINAISRSTSTSSYLPASVIDAEGYVKIRPTLHFLPSEQDSSLQDPYHLAAGDIAAWTGIRRCGAAMHMGSFAAHNIHAHIASTIVNSSSPPEYKSLSEHPPMIGLALGSTGIAYSPAEGIKSGPEVLKYMFQDDLGFGICWNYMKLGENPPTSDVVHAGPVEFTEKHALAHAATSTNADRDSHAARSTSDLTLDEWIAEAKSSHSHRRRTSSSTTASSNPALESFIDEQARQRQQQRRRLSATNPSPASASKSPSSPASDGSVPEPSTPFDAVGNANVTNFEVLESPALGAAVAADGSVGVVEQTLANVSLHESAKTPTTKVSPIRVVEGAKIGG